MQIAFDAFFIIPKKSISPDKSFQPRDGSGRALSYAMAWFHKDSSTRSGCVLGDTARKAKIHVEPMTAANRRSEIPVSRFNTALCCVYDRREGDPIPLNLELPESANA